MRLLPCSAPLRALASLAPVGLLFLVYAALTAEAQPSNSKEELRRQQGAASPFPNLSRAQQVAAKAVAMARIRDSQPKFRDDFVASGRDPHDLPVVELSPQIGVSRDLADAADQAVAIVRGTVVGQSLSPFLSEVEVTSVLRGHLDGAPLKVRQPGGPFLNGADAPALLQHRSDPLLRLGREYILFLDACENPLADPAAGIYCTAPMPAQIEVIGASLEVHENLRETWLTAYSGAAVADLENAIATVTPRSWDPGPWVPSPSPSWTPEDKRPSPDYS
jgi:hypothetical protein